MPRCGAPGGGEGVGFMIPAPRHRRGTMARKGAARRALARPGAEAEFRAIFDRRQVAVAVERGDDGSVDRHRAMARVPRDDAAGAAG